MIFLEPLWHRNKRCVAIRGRLTSEALHIVRNFPARLYSATNQCWYIHYSEQGLRELFGALEKTGPVEIRTNFYPVAVEDLSTTVQVIGVTLPREYEEQLVRMNYSPATVKGYCQHFRQFLEFIHPVQSTEIQELHIHRYLLYLVEKRKVSLSTQNQAINAIKFYLEQVKRGERTVYYVERPRKEWKLPTVLSDREIFSLLQATINVKHRCIMLMLYSTGLRMSELLALRWVDLDVDRKVIYVRRGKGRKDRVTLYSEVLMEYLSRYRLQYKPMFWIFEGSGGGPYSCRSVNNIIRRCAARAGIRKKVSAHTLRHSFATHLLEQGTDLRYIQSLLGHETSRTTELYAHVTKTGIEKIKSPLDTLTGGLKTLEQ